MPRGQSSACTAGNTRVLQRVSWWRGWARTSWAASGTRNIPALSLLLWSCQRQGDNTHARGRRQMLLPIAPPRVHTHWHPEAQHLLAATQINDWHAQGRYASSSKVGGRGGSLRAGTGT